MRLSTEATGSTPPTRWHEQPQYMAMSSMRPVVCLDGTEALYRGTSRRRPSGSVTVATKRAGSRSPRSVRRFRSTRCARCGQPTTAETCAYCRMVERGKRKAAQLAVKYAARS